MGPNGTKWVLMGHECMGPKLTQAEGFVLGVGAKMFSCCGARRMSLATVRLRPSPTAATATR